MIWRLAARLARWLPPETAHRLAVQVLAQGLAPAPALPPLPRLHQHLMGLDYTNPIGLAAGFDKNAEAVRGAFRLGFGAVETGTLTPLPQPGNPKPRVFRLNADGAVINRYGFNNDGIKAALPRLEGRSWPGVLGVNIGANKDSRDRIADYAEAASHLAACADIITVNVSSPNTPGLRRLESAALLAELVEAVKSGMGTHQRPILVKLSPDTESGDFARIIEAMPDMGVAGVILTNTTTHRPAQLASPLACEQGGLSGKPLLRPSTEKLIEARRRLQGRLTLIGVGGVDSPETAYAKILAGANLVQLYTALAFGGLHLPMQIIAGLDRLLERDGVKHISEATGQATRFDEAVRLATRGNDSASTG